MLSSVTLVGQCCVVGFSAWVILGHAVGDVVYGRQWGEFGFTMGILRISVKVERMRKFWVGISFLIRLWV